MTYPFLNRPYWSTFTILTCIVPNQICMQSRSGPGWTVLRAYLPRRPGLTCQLPIRMRNVRHPAIQQSHRELLRLPWQAQVPESVEGAVALGRATPSSAQGEAKAHVASNRPRRNALPNPMQMPRTHRQIFG